jgi:hypothetical protein
VVRQWACWALEGGEIRTALFHSLAAIGRAPLHRRSWSLFRYVVSRSLRGVPSLAHRWRTGLTSSFQPSLLAESSNRHRK